MKILFNGCSFTYGADLKDKNKRYSNYLSNDIVNLAVGGQSNDLIVDGSIDWLENNECDFVVIQFTFPNRISVIKNGQWTSIMPCTKGRKAKLYYFHIHDKEMGIRNLWKNVFTMEKYLESRNIPYFFWKLGKTHSKKQHSIYEPYRKLSKWKNMLHGSEFLHKHDRSLWVSDDKEHPNEKGHKLIADTLREYIK